LVPSAAPSEAAREDGDKGFVSRWSRLKREARERESGPVAPAPAAPVDPQATLPGLPAPGTLTFDSDYRQFLDPRVGEEVRRSALKKLFSDPRFNVMDGLDVYIDDYSKTEPIPAAMLAGLKQAQNILQWAKEDAEERQRKEEAGSKHVSGKMDPALKSPEAQPGAVDIPDSKASETTQSALPTTAASHARSA
jgi:hypothetical protein